MPKPASKPNGHSVGRSAGKPAGRSSGMSAGNAPGSSVSPRTRVVWCALLGAMTVGGGMLMLMGSPGRPVLDGLTLRPLAAGSSTTSLEGVLTTQVEIEPGRWQAIVIHHSGSTYATPQSLDGEHRGRGLAGLGYHFVIGNGSGLGDGEVHVGGRWLAQQPGAHTGGANGAWYDQNAIGICLVGDGDRRPFTRAQLDRLVRLTVLLGRQTGLSPDRVVLHNQVAETTSPGWNFPTSSFVEQLREVW